MKIEFGRERDILGKVLFMVASLPAKPEFHVEYTVKDAEKAKNELIARAVADSKIKAQVLTEAAGVGLGEIMTIDYSWGEIEFVTRPINRLAEPLMAYGGAQESSYDFDIEPDDIEVEDTVTVVWNLKD